MTSSFLEPEVPDITETIPSSISARVGGPVGNPAGGGDGSGVGGGGTGGAVYVDRTTRADIAINEMAFQFAIDDANPYQRQTSDFRRQQIDTSKEPGEQSLNQWWVRDQDSWHKGAGVNFYEPGSVDTSEYRFARSMGVDVWTEGQASLLRQTPQLIAATSGQNSYVTSAVVNAVNYFFGVVNGTLFRHDGTTRTNFTGFTAVASEPVVTGAKIVAGGSSGIWTGDVGGSTLTNTWTTATGVSARPFWAKSRLMVAQGPKLFDLTVAGTGSLDSTAALYVHPSTTWTWTGVTEAPGAIVAAGNDGGYGYIYKFVLEDAGTGLTATLGSAIQIADFPPGEGVYAIKSYLSQYLGIGTAKGLRVGTFTTNSNNDVEVQYGPLIIQTSQPVRCLSASDRFIYAGIEGDLDGTSGLARIDLSQEIVSQRYAYAFDAQAHTTGQVQSVSFLGVSDRVVFGILGKGVYLESASLYEPTGYIQSGKIRYGTSEPKTFNLLKVRARIPSLSGVSIDTLDEQDVDVFISRLTAVSNTAQDITLRALADVGSQYASIKLTLDSGVDNTVSPVLESMQLKATPQPKIQRDVKFPLRLVDVEQDRNGQKLGKAGSAFARLVQLETMEQEHTTVLVTDYTSGESYTAQIRQVSFVRDTPPSRNRKNFGGVVSVTVLKL